jgi:uncharacterized protein (TIGR00251 family)
MSFVCDITVSPSSSRQQWTLAKNGILKCFLKSPPEKGKANKELIEFLSKTLSIPKKEIEIISGLTSRKKRVTLPVITTFDELLKKLGIEQQQSLF